MKAKYYVMNTEQFGRAVFAQTDLDANEVVCYCEVLVLNRADTFIVSLTQLKDYTFTFSETQDCLVLGDGEIFNHDDNANVTYELINLNNRPLMVFRTSRACKANEQLFIDYNADVKEPVIVGKDKYTVNMM